MNCPSCEKGISYDWLSEECIEGNDDFNCPHCDAHLRYIIDEGSYHGAQEKSFELIDDDYS